MEVPTEGSIVTTPCEVSARTGTMRPMPQYRQVFFSHYSMYFDISSVSDNEDTAHVWPSSVTVGELL
jgi:hypothetical protein